jgi:hypothetical protein
VPNVLTRSRSKERVQGGISICLYLNRKVNVENIIQRRLAAFISRHLQEFRCIILGTTDASIPNT